MKYRHWFWDFDGTLFDTYPRICRALQKSLADAGIFEETAAIMPLLKKTLGFAAATYAERYHVPEQALLDGYHLHSEEEDDATMQPFPGMRDFLCAVVGQGAYNYLYTHRGETVFGALRRFDLEQLFTDRVTSLDGFPMKPAPDALLALMARNRLSSDDCVMVGDREIDVMAGLNAGMHAICLDPDGFCPPIPGVPMVRSYAELAAWAEGA